MIKDNILVAVATGILSVFLFLFGLLLFEYNALLDLHCQLRIVKQEYKQHLWHMKQLFDVYEITQKRVHYLESIIDHPDDLHRVHVTYAPSSSSDLVKNMAHGDADQCNEFVVLNRDLEYLKQSTHKYLRTYNRDLLLRSISHDAWLDYTHQVLNREKPKPTARRARRSVVKRKKQTPVPISSKVYAKEAVFSWPIDRSCFWLSSVFGNRKVKGVSRFHYGIDMAALKGTPVKAAAAGIVVEARYARGYGKTIVIQHNKKYKTRYAHLNRIRVRVGQKVARLAHIGDVGDTGFVHTSGADASHLHFEVTVFGERVNPQYYLT